MAKYNVGDKVRIVSVPRWTWNHDGEMDKYCGTVMTIKNAGMHYTMVEDDRWAWGDDDIVCKVDDETTNKEERKMKFKVGDIVKANELSNDEYAFTTLQNEWVGEVVEVYDVDDEYEDDFRAITTHCKDEGFVGDYFGLHSKYFDLVEETESKPATVDKPIKEDKPARYQVGDHVEFDCDIFKGVGKIVEITAEDEYLVELPKTYHGQGHTAKFGAKGHYTESNYWFIGDVEIKQKVNMEDTPTTVDEPKPAKKTVSKKFTKGVDVDLVQDMYRTVTDPKTKQVTFSPVKMVHLVFVQFDDNSKVYTFNNPTDTRLKKGTRVLVDTRFGEKIATVVTSIKIQKKYLHDLMVGMGNDTPLKDVLGTIETVKETITHEKVKRFEEPKPTKKVFSAKKFVEVEDYACADWEWVKLLDGLTTDEIDELGYAWDESWLVEVAA